MYIVNISKKIADDRTEEEIFCAILQDCYRKIAEVASTHAATPTDELISFGVHEFTGTLPIDVVIYGGN